jgi:hypothetical protein
MIKETEYPIPGCSVLLTSTVPPAFVWYNRYVIEGPWAADAAVDATPWQRRHGHQG